MMIVSTRNSVVVKIVIVLVLVVSFLFENICFVFVKCVENRQQHHHQQQQNITRTIASLSEARRYLAATSWGELVFFGGGLNSTGPSNRVDIYNVTSGNWTTSTLSIPRRELAATSSQNLVFFGGGWDGNITFYKRVDIYNTLNGSWSTATLSYSRCCFASTSVGNFVLFGGGYFSNSTGDYVYSVVDVYDVSSGSWNFFYLNDFRSDLAATTVADRYALFAGGFGVSNISNVVDIFDSLSQQLTTATLSQARYWLAATSLGNLAFFGGGFDGNQASNVVDIFNSTSQTWSTATLSQARYGLAASSIGDIVAFGGGWDGSTSYSVVDMFSLTSNTWFTTTLSQARSWLASTSSTNKIFFGGGVGVLGPSKFVDIFEIPPPPPRPPTSPPVSPISVPVGSTSSSTPTVPISISQFPSFPPFQNDTSTNTNLSTQPSSTQSDNLPIGAIVGIAVGGAVLLIGGILLLIILLVKRRKHQKILLQLDTQLQTQQSQQPQQPQQSQQPQQPQQGTELPQKLSSTQFPLLTRTSQTSLQNISSSNLSLGMTFTQGSMKHSLIPFNELVIEKELEEGSYGKVYSGRWKNARVALKFCRKKKGVDNFQKEIQILIELPPHPNVVQMYGISTDGPTVVLVLEYCDGVSLDRFLFETHPRLTHDQMISLASGIASGMCHLHQHNIVHRDLAARNILLTQPSGNGDPKITDFGMSRILESDTGQTQSNIGPVCWMAPESIAQRVYSKKSDVWMYGIVLYEIVAQSEPHKNMDVVDAAVAIRDHGLTPTIPPNCPIFLRQLMEACWKRDPEQRPTFEDICNRFQQYLINSRRVT